MSRSTTVAVLAIALAAGPAATGLGADRVPAGGDRAATTSGDVERLSSLDGTVGAIDRETRWVRIASPSPSGRELTLVVVDRTEVLRDGRAATIQEIREGDLVKASYESRHGIHLARSIEVTSSGPGRPASPDRR